MVEIDGNKCYQLKMGLRISPRIIADLPTKEISSLEGSSTRFGGWTLVDHISCKLLPTHNSFLQDATLRSPDVSKLELMVLAGLHFQKYRKHK